MTDNKEALGLVRQAQDVRARVERLHVMNCGKGKCRVITRGMEALAFVEYLIDEEAETTRDLESLGEDIAKATADGNEALLRVLLGVKSGKSAKLARVKKSLDSAMLVGTVDEYLELIEGAPNDAI